MSDSEIQRFISDIKSDETLRMELTSQASGVGSVVEFARSHGYDETSARICARSWVKS